MSKDLSFLDAATPRKLTSPAAIKAVDTVAQELGFVSREAQPLEAMPLKRRKPIEEPIFSFTARVSVRSGNKFIAWCEREGLTYREGFDRLVATLDQA
jgi:hypothetical protein